MPTLTRWIQAPFGVDWSPWKPRFDQWMSELREHVQDLLDTMTANATVTSYTPTWTQSTTISKTVDFADYTVKDGWLFGEVHMTATGVSNGTALNAMVAGLPVTPLRTQNRPIAYGWFIDASSGNLYDVIGYRSGPTSITFVRTNDESTNPYLGASGFTAAVTTNDVLSFVISYRVS